MKSPNSNDSIFVNKNSKPVDIEMDEPDLKGTNQSVSESLVTHPSLIMLVSAIILFRLITAKMKTLTL